MNNSDKAISATEKKDTQPSISHADVFGSVGSSSQKPSTDANKTETEAEVKAGNLPALSVGDAQNKHWWSGGLAIAEDLGKGAYNEVTQHPLHLVESAAIGAVAGVGLALATPEIAIGAAVIGGGYAAYQLYENGGKWVNAASTVANESGHTPQEIAAAHSTVQGLGADAADLAAGVAAGAVGGRLAMGLRAVPEVAPVVRTPAPPPEVTTPAAVAQIAPVAQVAPVVPPNPVASPPVDAPAAPEAPSMYNEPLIYDRVATVPFTQGETSIQLSNPELWNSLVDTNGKNAYGAVILRFANRWAAGMEEKMAAGEPLSKSMIMAAADKADTFGTSGAMASQVENLLSQTWKYGPEFLKIVDAPYTPKA